MKTLPAALFLLSALTLWSISQASENGKTPLDCCLSTSPKKIPKHAVKSYVVQTSGNGCNIDAVAFQTRKGKILCSPPQLKWVIQLKKAIDKQNKRSKKQRRLRAKQN